MYQQTTNKQQASIKQAVDKQQANGKQTVKISRYPKEKQQKIFFLDPLPSDFPKPRPKHFPYSLPKNCSSFFHPSKNNFPYL
jgi:hypothetical protein